MIWGRWGAHGNLKLTIINGKDDDLKKQRHNEEKNQSPEAVIYQRFQSFALAGAEGLEVAPQKHSRIARLERFALLLVSSPHRRAFLRRRRRRNGSPRHAPRASVSYNSIRIKQKRHPKVSCFFGRGRRTWTLGTRFWRPLLYQLSYTPMNGGPPGTRTPDHSVMSRVL